MAKAIVTMKLATTSPDVDMEQLTQNAQSCIKEHTTGDIRCEVEPMAFGLKALKVTFVVDEDESSTDTFESALGQLEGVQSVQTIDMRRALG